MCFIALVLFALPARSTNWGPPGVEVSEQMGVIRAIDRRLCVYTLHSIQLMECVSSLAPCVFSKSKENYAQHVPMRTA